jgi:hypothetical protein
MRAWHLDEKCKWIASAFAALSVAMTKGCHRESVFSAWGTRLNSSPRWRGEDGAQRQVRGICIEAPRDRCVQHRLDGQTPLIGVAMQLE